VDTNTQTAPFPTELAELVQSCRYRPGWTVELTDMDRGQKSAGLTLIIMTATVNTYRPDENIYVNHLFPVPPAAYDTRSWRRWLFERFHDVELHECAEFFQIGDERPFAPSHGPGNDPYLIREIGTDVDQRTTFRGEVK
jgi:hypothetical protein